MVHVWRREDNIFAQITDFTTQEAPKYCPLPPEAKFITRHDLIGSSANVTLIQDKLSQKEDGLGEGFK